MKYSEIVTTKIAAKTASYTVLVGDRFTIFTNEGAGSEVEFTLPSAVTGTGPFSFAVSLVVGVKITAGAGDTIRIGSAETATAGDVSSTRVGAVLTLICAENNKWVTTHSQEAW